MNKAISKGIKEQILARVREGKETVVGISRQHGVKVNTVYDWISRDVNGKQCQTTLHVKHVQSEDEKFRAEEELQKITDEHIAKIDDLSSKKEQEITSI